MTFDPKPNPAALDPRQKQMALDSKPKQMALDPGPSQTARDPKQNQRRIYISMRVPQARDEMREVAEAMRELRGRPKPLIRTAEDQTAGRQIVFCRERMKEIRGEIQRLLQERTAILPPRK